MGIKVTKIHKVIKFKQDNIMKDYVELNIKLRKEATSKSAGNMFKLMNNALFGKTCENLEKRVDFKILPKGSDKIIKSQSKKTFKERFDYPDYTLIQYYKKEVYYNLPAYLGTAILDLSKLYMFHFWYDIMGGIKDRKLHYIDTDSFIFSYPDTEENQKEFIKLNDYFDFSNLDKDDPMYNTKNEKKLGTFTIETGSKKINGIIVLRAKSYCILGEEKELYKKEKGINKDIVAETEFKEYYNALFKDETRIVANPSIRSNITKHDNVYENSVQTIITHKLSLNTFDDKRFYVNKVVSYPHDKKFYLLKNDIIEGVKKKYENDVNLKEREINVVKETLDKKLLIELYNKYFPLDLDQAELAWPTAD